MKKRSLGLGGAISIIGLGVTGVIFGRITSFTNSFLLIIGLAIILAGVFLEINNNSKE